MLDKFHATSYHTLHEQDLLDLLQLVIDRSNPSQHSRPSASITAVVNSSPTKTIGYRNQSQLAIGIRSTLPLSAPGNHIQWKKDPRMAVYRNLASLGAQTSDLTSKDEGLKRLLRDASKDPTLLDLADSVTLLPKKTGSTLFGFMIRGDEEPSLSAPLISLGIDSLISIELRNWFRQKVEVDFTVLELLNSNNILHLGEQAATKLKEKFQTRL